MKQPVTPGYQEALAIKALIKPSIPRDFQADWASVAAWFWLKADGPGIGGGAHVYDRLGYPGGFNFDLLPILPLLTTLRMHHPDFPKLWIGCLMQFGREDHQMILTYEFELSLRWTVTPDNYKTQIRVNRPDLSTLGW
jgi:hypothetical protein